VIWDFQGQPVPAGLLDDVRALGERLRTDAVLRAQLLDLVTESEFARLEERIALIDRVGIYPSPPAYRPYPWPMI
jgi:hypothetical protein